MTPCDETGPLYATEQRSVTLQHVLDIADNIHNMQSRRLWKFSHVVAKGIRQGRQATLLSQHPRNLDIAHLPARPHTYVEAVDIYSLLVLLFSIQMSLPDDSEDCAGLKSSSNTHHVAAKEAEMLCGLEMLG